MPFLDSLDLANRSCDHLGQSHIDAVDEDSKKNTLLANAYDKLRPAELRRNLWAFSKRKAMLRPIGATTRLLAPRAWDEDVTYQPGAVVKDDNGVLWTSGIAANLGNEPGTTSAWDQYFGPMTVEEYDADTSYYAGELVYSIGSRTGSFVVYRSLVSGNEDDPETTDAYDATVTYDLGDVVSYSGSQWRSKIAVNLGTTPAEPAAAYNAAVTYAISQTCTGSDGYKYSSVGNGNTGNDPVLDGGVNWTNTGVAAAWTAVPVLWSSASSWVPVFAGLENISIVYPLGTGPSAQASTANLFRKPAGWLRKAVVDPKGVKGYDQTETMGNYIIGGDSPMLVEFGADILTVTDMDPMFCEGLAARMALETCEAITQSLSKFQRIGNSYQTFMTEARIVNAITDDYEEAPQDDWLSVRI